jgi:hypothetical protein
MQAFAVVEGLVELDVFRLGRMAQVININMPQAAELGFDAAEHSVVGMTGIASFVGGYAVILKVSGGKVHRVIHTQTLAIWLHDVAAQTELRGLGTIQFRGKSHTETK